MAKSTGRRRFLERVVSVSLGAGFSCSAPAIARGLSFVGNDGFQAGTFSVDITPPIGYRMSGYFEERRSTGILDPLFAKALVLRQGREVFTFVSCDLIGLSPDVTDRARAEASKRTGIAPDRIMVAATHSHTGPLYFGVLRDYFHRLAAHKSGMDPCEVIDYKEKLVRDIADAVDKAAERIEPATLQLGKGCQEGLSFNRRYLMKDGTIRFNPGIRNPEIVKPVGPVDPSVLTLFLSRPGNKEPFAALANFSLHLDTTGGTRFSADYPFFLQESLREDFGPEFTLLFGTGTCGDINHIDVTNEQRLKPDAIGRTLARTIRTNWEGRSDLVNLSLASSTSRIQVPLQTFSSEDLAWAQENIAKVGTPALGFLDQVKACRILDLHNRKSGYLDAEVQAVRLGRDVALVGFPGEIFVELGLDTKQASPFANTLVVELCRDAPGYLPTRKAFREGSYEIVNSRVAPGAPEALVEKAASMLKDLA